MPGTIWEYYKKLAEIRGLDEEGEPQGFSVSWFYDMFSEGGIHQNLNRLALAFLGDENALNSVYLAPEADIIHMNGKVKSICGNKPYDSQIEAVSNALLNDITIIQGPPGTGKTETIKNIVLSIRNIYPEAKIAVISANSEAINNAVDAVKTENDLKNSYARLGNKRIRKAYMAELSVKNRELSEQLQSCDEDSDFLFPGFFLDYYPVIFSTIHSVRKCVDIDEYDYVLVDECSQVPSFIGMIALTTAKHLVLLGDDEQLPPIHKDWENDNIENVPGIRNRTPWYLDEGDNSFMKACKESFGEKCRSILLNEHYRCHPAIIEFCNRYVYGSKLVTKTADDGKLPIRIRWYEGDYWEKIQPDPEKRAVNYNKMQIEVFVEDELPEIRKLLESDEKYSICVLSPYRCQLDLLKERLDEVLSEADSAIENRVEDEQPGVNDLQQLTIHKAQGRGYDRVYIMPVEDAGKNPWSQKKELINVAVSRAKKELIVITSSTWMSKELQIKLTGNCVDNSKMSEQCYIRDLLEYVEHEQNNRNVTAGYGFVKTSIDSLFARVPVYREKYRFPDEKKKPEGNRTSAPEYCMKKALEDCKEITDEFDILREVPLKAIEGIKSDDEEVNQYIDDGARFDFVIAKDDKVYAIIEVDGAYHRSDPETMHNDELKNRAVKALGEAVYNEKFIRIPTDGTVKDEVSLLYKTVSKNVSSTITFDKNERMGNHMIDYFDEKMRECADIISKHIVKGELDDDVKDILRATDYQNPTGNDYHYDDKLYNAVYFIRYGYAYAYEYSVLYEILLDDYDGKKFGVTSLGCGSCIDAWSLAYAKEKAGKDVNLLYVGTDLSEWGIRFIPEKGNAMEKAYKYGNASKMRYPEKGKLKDNILHFYKTNTIQYDYNTLLFPKILNELKSKDLDDLVECIKKDAKRFEADRNHYICISHSRTHYNDQSMQTIAQRICEAINYDNRFEVICDLPKKWTKFVKEHEIKLVDISKNGNYPCYAFPNEEQDDQQDDQQDDKQYYVDNLNKDFQAIDEVKIIRKTFNDFLDSEGLRWCVTRTSTSLFQIVKLTPKGDNS